MAKKKLEVNKDKKIKTSKGKNVLLSGLLAATLMTGCGDGKKVGNGLDEKKSNPIEVVEKNKYEGKSIDGVEGMIISENPNTKQLFLSDGKEKLTSDFDNIKNVVKVGEDLYFVGGNGGKHSLYKNGEAILSDFDDIDYRIIDGKIVTITENAGKKTVKRGDEILKENCEEAGFNIIRTTKNYNGEDNRNNVNDSGYAVWSVEKGGKWSVFVNGKLYLNGTGGDGDLIWCFKYHVSGFDAKGSIIMIIDDDSGMDRYSERANIGTVYLNGKSLGKVTRGGGVLLGMQSIIFEKENGKQSCLSLKTGEIIGTEYDEIYAGGPIGDGDYGNYGYTYNQDHLIFSAKKNGKSVFVIDGEDYFVDTKIHDESYYPRTTAPLSSNITFLKKGGKNYFVDEGTCIVHEYKGNYDSIECIDKTSDGIVYFIGKKGNKEYFVFNGEVQGNGYDYISGAGLVEGEHIYVRGERDGEQIFVLNGTERGADSTTNNSQERKSDLFTR